MNADPSPGGSRKDTAAAAAPPVAPAAPGGALQIEAVLQAIEPMIGQGLGSTR